jgi:gliding motility-associated-like protein
MIKKITILVFFFLGGIAAITPAFAQCGVEKYYSVDRGGSVPSIPFTAEPGREIVIYFATQNIPDAIRVTVAGRDWILIEIGKECRSGTPACVNGPLTLLVDSTGNQTRIPLIMPGNPFLDPGRFHPEGVLEVRITLPASASCQPGEIFIHPNATERTVLSYVIECPEKNNVVSYGNIRDTTVCRGSRFLGRDILADIEIAQESGTRCTPPTLWRVKVRGAVVSFDTTQQCQQVVLTAKPAGLHYFWGTDTTAAQPNFKTLDRGPRGHALAVRDTVGCWQFFGFHFPRIPELSTESFPDTTVYEREKYISLPRPKSLNLKVSWGTMLTGGTLVNSGSTFLRGPFPPYEIPYTLRDQHGCEYSDIFRIHTIPNPRAWFPNVFSPNGDGANESFHGFTNGSIEILEYSIFDRWGELVYQGIGNDEGWDGRFRGQDCQPGVYGWMARVRETLTGRVEIMKGGVTLVR